MIRSTILCTPSSESECCWRATTSEMRLRTFRWTAAAWLSSKLWIEVESVGAWGSYALAEFYDSIEPSNSTAPHSCRSTIFLSSAACTDSNSFPENKFFPAPKCSEMPAGSELISNMVQSHEKEKGRWGRGESVNEMGRLIKKWEELETVYEALTLTWISWRSQKISVKNDIRGGKSGKYAEKLLARNFPMLKKVF